MVNKKRFVVLVAFMLIIGLLAGCSSSKEASAPKAESYITVAGDTVLAKACVNQNRYHPGNRIVFRAKVTDPATGEIVENANVKLVFADGQEFPMKLGEHGADKVKFWTVGYNVPEDATTGTLEFTYVADADGKKAEYKPFEVAPSKLTIVAADVPVAGEDAIPKAQ